MGEAFFAVSATEDYEQYFFFFQISLLALVEAEKQIFEIRVRKIMVLRKLHSKIITKIQKRKSISQVLFGSTGLKFKYEISGVHLITLNFHLDLFNN